MVIVNTSKINANFFQMRECFDYTALGLSFFQSGIVNSEH